MGRQFPNTSYSAIFPESSFFFREGLVPQMVKNLPAIQETRVWSLGQEDPLENGMATHSSILAWRILWTEESGRLQSMGLQRVRHDLVTNSSLRFTENWEEDWVISHVLCSHSCMASSVINITNQNGTSSFPAEQKPTQRQIVITQSP